MTALYIDVATTHLWQWKLPLVHPAQPYIVRLAYAFENRDGELTDRTCVLIRPLPDQPRIDANGRAFSGIEDADLQAQGVVLGVALTQMERLLRLADRVVGHNVIFHQRALQRAWIQTHAEPPHFPPTACTMRLGAPVVCIARQPNGQWKWPTLAEAYERLERKPLTMPADPIARGHATIDAVHAVYHDILVAEPLL